MFGLRSLRVRPPVAGGILGLAVLLGPSGAEAQQLQGVVLESGSQARVQGASITLLDTTFTAIVTTSTNSSGAFRIQAPGPGSYFVLTEALGYRPVMDGILDFEEGGSMTVEIYLEPKPIELDSLKIAVERVETYQLLERAGFNDRVASGFGAFITPEEIRKRNPRFFFELFRNTPGVRVTGSALNSTTIELTHGSVRGATCTPPVYVDGIPVSLEFGGLEAAVSVDQIAGVEVYTRASSVPLEWGGTNAGCGIVLIWTR